MVARKRTRCRATLFIFFLGALLIFGYYQLQIRTYEALQQTKRHLGAITDSSLRFSTQLQHETFDRLSDHVQLSGVRKVLHNVRKCLNITNMAQTTSKHSLASKNAGYLYKEFRKIIPVQFLSHYSSHCWEMHFDVTLLNGGGFQGHLGPIRLSGSLLKGPRSLAGPLSQLKFAFKGQFSSELVCLPSIFMIGFPKCGSTYFWCFLKRLLELATNTNMSFNAGIEKESHFWVKGAANISRYIKTPKARDIGEYLLNYLHALDTLGHELESIQAPLMDGSPNTIFNWPRFDQRHPPDVNYCIVPSVLPELLPKAKFVVVMRNPINMLYSAFWFSCTTIGHILSREVQEEAPLIFHNRVRSKIERFLRCMVDANNPTPCSIDDKATYDLCIRERLHLVDHCVFRISYNDFEEPMPKCGKVRIETVLYLPHVRKWLSVVPRTSMFFVSLEKLTAEPKVTSTNLLKFLGYPPRDDILDNLHVSKLCLSSENVQNVVNYKEDPKLVMKMETREILQRFFDPFNSLLSDLLNDNSFTW